MVVQDFLKECTDKEIFEIVIYVGSEIKRRIINLLKQHYCSSVQIPGNDEVTVGVNNLYEVHDWAEDVTEKTLSVAEIGFSNSFVNGEVFEDILYVVTKNGEQYSHDEINEDTLWDVYKTIRDLFEKY